MTNREQETPRALLLWTLARENLEATVADDGTVRFAAALDVDGSRIGAFFAEGLTLQGVPSHTLAVARTTPAMRDLADRIAAACAHTRRRLVAEGSFVSGGAAVPFAATPELARSRGLALYRFPRRSRARLRVSRRGVRIRVPAGPLGDITSVGFWLPTFVAGDFDVQIVHRLKRWQPGSGPACFGLHAADQTTARTYYAQWTSEPGQPHRPGCVLGDRPLQHGHPPAKLHGVLRLRREGCLVTAWFRSDDGFWQLLGSHGDDQGAPMVVGAKVWAFGDCGGLDVAVTDLRLEGVPCDVGEAPPPLLGDAQCRVWKWHA